MKPTITPTIAPLPGFRAAGIHCGLKAADALDFALIVSDSEAVTAGVFTVNTVKAAPVLVNQETLVANPTRIRAVAINSGCANACTGDTGIDNALATAACVADALGCAPESVLVLSTGVIGTQLPMNKIATGVEQAEATLGDDWEAAARAIMTTDTYPKLASVQVTTDQGTYTIAGISKGAGMIAPNMATMLAVIVTDAALPLSTLDECLRTSADRTYNRIVVDGDMSPNDTVLLLANGASGVTIHSDTDRARFQAALDAVCEHLAQAIVRDGEGATTFITLNVSGTATDAEARQVANTVATSPLVKTAFYGGDANWGRIIAAAGRSGVSAPLDSVALAMAAGGDHVALVAGGLPLDYDDALANAIAAQSEVVVHLQWGAGPGTATVWTCDLTHDYVSINGHYRT